MGLSFSSPERGGQHEQSIETTIEITTIKDLPEEILAKALLGSEAPLSHRRICKQLRSLFDESCTQLRIRNRDHLSLDPSAVHAESGCMHGDLLSLLTRLPRLDALLVRDGSCSPALPWTEMGQIHGRQLTYLILKCNWKPKRLTVIHHHNWQLGFLDLFPSLRRLEVKCGDPLCGSEMTAPTLELQPLSALRDLQHLELRGLPVRDLGPLASCSQLQFLDMAGCPIEDLGPLTGCNHLQLLCLARCLVEDLGSLKGCSWLRFLDLTGCPIESLQPLVQCTELHTLKLSSIQTLRDLGPLGACASLQHLELGGCLSITNLKPLEQCTNLLCLDLFASRASDFEALSSCTGLQSLNLFGCRHLHSLAPLASCRNLQRLNIGYNTIISFEPLWGLQELQHLYLDGTHTTMEGGGQPELGPLTRVKHLHLHEMHMPLGF